MISCDGFDTNLSMNAPQRFKWRIAVPRVVLKDLTGTDGQEKMNCLRVGPKGIF
jgi:hypothetical protein